MRGRVRYFHNRSVGKTTSGYGIATTTDTAPSRSLVDLLGESRAEVVRRCKDVGDATVSELADHLGISEAATRKHVDRLAEDGLLTSRTVKQGRGRPVARWSLTDAALELFPRRTDELATELLDFLADRGRTELGAFLRWRQERQVAAYARRIDGEDVAERIAQLADALSADGYRAEAVPDGDGFVLRQTHCAIEDVAREQPLLCAHEAAAFGRLLGEGVRVTRRETLAKGDGACVCHVQLREPLPNALPVIPVDSPTTSCCEPAPPTSPTTTEDA